MARFYGAIGYGHSVTNAGVSSDVITERKLFGDVLKNSRQLREGENLNRDISVQNSISVVADAYANDHFHNIRFVEWLGALWTVEDVTVEAPRLILRLGGIYNGPRAETPAPGGP